MGQIVLGLGLLFIGMNTMSSAVEPLKNLPEFQSVFTAFSNPLLGVAVGAAVTALLQSSSASMGILQAISTTGVVSFNIAMPLIMGQNIGTCITALISSVGASKNAKRTAMIHLFFNIIGSVFFLVVLYAGNALFRFPFWENTMDMGSIANLHLAFNIACTALLLPFHRQLVKLVKAVVPGDAEERELSVLDDRFLSSPSLALERAHDAVVQMSEFARDKENINGGLLVNVTPEDYGGAEDPLAGIAFQRKLESAAYALGGGDYRAPAQRVGDFLAGRPSVGPGRVHPSYRPGVTWTDLRRCLPPFVADTIAGALPLLGQKLRGYDDPDAVLTAVESRSSSPVRIPRDGTCQSSLRGLYPCGEGAGYAGGILSAAADGMHCAEQLCQSIQKESDCL